MSWSNPRSSVRPATPILCTRMPYPIAGCHDGRYGHDLFLSNSWPHPGTPRTEFFIKKAIKRTSNTQNLHIYSYETEESDNWLFQSPTHLHPAQHESDRGLCFTI